MAVCPICPICSGSGAEPAKLYWWRFREMDGSWSQWFQCTREEFETKQRNTRDFDTLWNYVATNTKEPPHG